MENEKKLITDELIDDLYDECIDTHKVGLEGTDKELKKFVEKYFPEEKGYSEKVDSVLSDVIDIYLAERRCAFEAGFRLGLEYKGKLSE